MPLRGPILALAAILQTGPAIAPGSPLIEFHLHAASDAVVVEVDNRSGGELCANRVGGDGHWSPELFIQIRPLGRKPLKPFDLDYLPPPDDGLRIPPGRSVLDHYGLAEHYPRFRNKRGVAPGRWEAKAFFRFHHCGDTDWRNMESDWAPI